MHPADAIVRRSRPESGFRSIELTQPWRIAPLAGVNEAGLAVATLDPSPSISDHLESAEDVLHWLEGAEEVDAGRLGLIGCERGAIVAAR